MTRRIGCSFNAPINTRLGEKRRLECSSSYHHLLCSSLSLNPRSFSVPSTLKACPCCRLRVQAQACPQESRRESRSIFISAYMRSIYAHTLTLLHPVFFIYVNIIHSPRHRVRPLSLSVHITPPRTCCFCLCPYVPRVLDVSLIRLWLGAEFRAQVAGTCSLHMCRRLAPRRGSALPGPRPTPLHCDPASTPLPHSHFHSYLRMSTSLQLEGAVGHEGKTEKT